MRDHHDNRWLDDPNLPGSLKQAMAESRDRLPSEADIERLAKSVAAHLPPGGGPSGGTDGNGGAGPSIASVNTGLPSTAMVAAAAAIAAMVAIAIILFVPLFSQNTAPSPEPPMIPADRPTSTPPESAASGAVPRGVGSENEWETAPLPVAPQTAPALPQASPPSPQHARLNEAALLAKAKALVQENPRKAMALTQMHARRFPEGTLIQEREAIAIRALFSMGRIEAARQRGMAFLAEYPTSIHRSAVQSLLQKHESHARDSERGR